MRHCLASLVFVNRLIFGRGQQERPRTRRRSGPHLPVKAGQRRLALLVGRSKYDRLPERFTLRGPGNDVVVDRKVLTERFGITHLYIVKLAEALTPLAGRARQHRCGRHFVEQEVTRLTNGRQTPTARRENLVVDFTLD